MFELTFTTAFMIYISFTMFVILGIWLTHHYRKRNKTVLSEEKTLYLCEFCLFAYMADNLKELNKCPRCGLLNKHNAYEGR